MSLCRQLRGAIVLFGLLCFLTGDTASAFKLAPAITGAKVTGVTANSPAQRVGLEPGDVIVGIDNQPIRTQEDFARLIGSSTKVTLLIRDVRTGQYKQADAFPSNGKLGFRFVMATVPEVVLPPPGDIKKR